MSNETTNRCPKCESDDATDFVERNFHHAMLAAKGTTAVTMFVGSMLTGGILVPVLMSAVLGGAMIHIFLEGDEGQPPERFECRQCHHRWD